MSDDHKEAIQVCIGVINIIISLFLFVLEIWIIGLGFVIVGVGFFIKGNVSIYRIIRPKKLLLLHPIQLKCGHDAMKEVFEVFIDVMNKEMVKRQTLNQDQ